MLDMTTPVQARSQRWDDDETELHFDSAEELCGFVQSEIRRSKMSYKELAAKAHVCASTVSKMAAGDTRFPRMTTIFEILRVLGCELAVRR